MKPALTILILFLTGCQAIAADYREMLTREAANRAVARHVVSYLAEADNGTERGAFWTAYRDLEAAQKPRYDQIERCEAIEAGGLVVWTKSRLSAIFARLFPETFIGLLADATVAYLGELKRLSQFPDPLAEDFWRYVVAQEAAQVEALNLARQGDLVAARQTLQTFVAEQTPSVRSFLGCR